MTRVTNGSNPINASNKRSVFVILGDRQYIMKPRTRHVD